MIKRMIRRVNNNILTRFFFIFQPVFVLPIIQFSGFGSTLPKLKLPSIVYCLALLLMDVYRHLALQETTHPRTKKLLIIHIKKAFEILISNNLKNSL